MSQPCPLRIYMANKGDFGIIYMHHKGSDVLMRNLSLKQAQSIVGQTMATSADNLLTDKHAVRNQVALYAKIVRSESTPLNHSIN